MSVSGRIFEIARNRSQNNALCINVNFDAQVVALFKEVRNLFWQQNQIPHGVSNVAKDAKRVYPFAVSLMETTRAYTQTVKKVQDNGSGIASLVAIYHRNCQNMIQKGINLRWDYFVNTLDHQQRAALQNFGVDARENRHVLFVQEFAGVVAIYQDKVDGLLSVKQEIGQLIDELGTCVYRPEKFNTVLEQIQKLVDRLNLENYSNLNAWVQDLDRRVELILTSRLQQALRSWIYEFQHVNDDGSYKHIENRDTSSKFLKKSRRRTRIGFYSDADRVDRDQSSEDTRPALKVLVHEIRIRNQVMFLDPPIDHARSDWFNQLHDWLGMCIFIINDFSFL